MKLKENDNEIIDIESNEDIEKRAKEELNHPNFKKWFKGLLEVSEVELYFKKQDGTERKMRCTLNVRDIPEDKLPKGSSRKVPEDSIAVFDIEKQDWRSFRYDSIIEFGWEQEDGVDYPTSPTPVFFDENGNEIVEEESPVKEFADIEDVEIKEGEFKNA
jgi:hypothetical protein